MTDIRKAFKNAEKLVQNHVVNIVKGGVLEMFGEIVERTPVGDPTKWKSKAPKGYVGGRLRANWQIGVNSAKLDEIDGTDSAGGSTITQAENDLRSYRFRKNDTIYITNNLPYAEAIEEGHSTQSRAGAMLKVPVTKFTSLINKAIKKVL